MKSSDLRSTTNHEYMKMFGDFVVGSYAEDGKQLSAPLSADPEHTEKLGKMIAANAQRAGATLLTATQANKSVKGKEVKGKKGKQPIAPITAPMGIDSPIPLIYNPVEEPVVVKKKSIFLHNKLGKIKMSVEAVLENEMAFCLVFSNDDDVIFIPNAGETLNFVDHNGNTCTVYYADTLFHWTDGIKKLMILFKRNEE